MTTSTPSVPSRASQQIVNRYLKLAATQIANLHGDAASAILPGTVRHYRAGRRRCWPMPFADPGDHGRAPPAHRAWISKGKAVVDQTFATSNRAENITTSSIRSSPATYRR